MDIDIGKGLRVNVARKEIEKIEAIADHVFKIGMRNILMDSHASVKRDDCESDQDYRDKSLAIAMKKLEKMLNGEIRANSGGTRVSSVDPITKMAREIAKGIILPRVKDYAKNDEHMLTLLAIAEKLSMAIPESGDERDSAIKSVIAAAIAKNAETEKVLAEAKQRVEATAKISVNVDDLF